MIHKISVTALARWIANLAGGGMLAFMMSLPLSAAWGGMPEVPDPDRAIPLKLAVGCPAEFTDGHPQPPDINPRSCHTVQVRCQRGESAVNCGKRALMAGDWETAVGAFDLAPDDSGEAIYGRYLARLFRLYADFNNMFFGDVFGEGFNQVSLTRDLNTPLNNPGRVYIGHYVCLANTDYFPGPNPYLRQQWSIEYGTSLIDKYLDQIILGKHTLRGVDGGPLPIRWVQGKCHAPLYDAIFQGVWDWVDAVLLYQHLFGSPAETKRFDIGLIFSESSRTPCQGELCGPYSKDDLHGRPVPVPRLSDDAEWFLDRLFRASQALFDPERVVPGEEPVFYWRDTNGNGTVDASDGFTVQLYKTDTMEPLLALEDATLGAQWTPRQADPPGNPAPIQPFIFCPKGPRAPDCFVFEGEEVLEAPVPVWLQLWNKPGLLATPSPDGAKLLFVQTVRVRDEDQLHLFVTDNALDEQGNPLCSDPDGDCCLTCQVLPQGIRIFGTPDFEWIPDPANPQGPARGVFYMHNEHPSAWGWGGQAMGSQFFAIRPDGTGNSRLLVGAPPAALHYQTRVSPDGGQLLWASTWDPESNRAGTSTLLLADIVLEDEGFRLADVHSVVPVRDHGWYETGDFATDYPNDRRIFFTSSSLSMQSPRVFAATLTPEGVIEEVFKLTHPEEVFPEPFVADLHPGWYEFPRPMDRGRQISFVTSDPKPVAADRYDRFLTFPPYLEGVLFGLTLYDIRFAGLDGKLGYSDLDDLKEQNWIAHLDGANRRTLESFLQASLHAGWRLTKKLIGPGQIFFIQKNLLLGRTRFGVLRAPE